MPFSFPPDDSRVADYAAVRSYAGASKNLYVTGYLGTTAPSGMAGPFTVDDVDTTSPDNGGTILVITSGPNAGKRVKRVFSGPVDVRWFGAKLDGAADDAAPINAALTAWPSAEIHVCGPAFVSSTIKLDGFSGKLVFEGNAAKLLAGADNLIVFQSTTNAYGCKLIDPCVNGNGHVGVTAFDLTRLQLEGSEIVRPRIRDCSNGIILRSLCWGLKIDAPQIDNTAAPIVLISGNNAVQINHPRLDTFTGPAGIDIQTGGALPNIGNQVLNGFVQGGTIGVRDAGYNTQVLGTYFERCTAADISLIPGSFYFLGIGTNHTSSGTVAYKGRGTVAARVYHPFMSSGGRTTGLFDFDNSNSNCLADYTVSMDSKNTPVGTTTGIATIWAQPGAIGSATPNSGAFTTLNSSSTATLFAMQSASGVASVPTAVATTIFSIVAANRGEYQLVAMVANSGSAPAYTAKASILWDGTQGRIASADAGASLTISIAGGNVQVTQTSGAVQNVNWWYSRVGS